MEVGDSTTPVGYSGEGMRHEDILRNGIDQGHSVLVDRNQQMLRVVGISVLLYQHSRLVTLGSDLYPLPYTFTSKNAEPNVGHLNRYLRKAIFAFSELIPLSWVWKFRICWKITNTNVSAEFDITSTVNTFFHSLGLCVLIKSFGMISWRKFLEWTKVIDVIEIADTNRMNSLNRLQLVFAFTKANSKNQGCQSSCIFLHALVISSQQFGQFLSWINASSQPLMIFPVWQQQTWW